MSETISVTFTADSSKFQQEAAKVVGSISQVEKASARARNVGLPQEWKINPLTAANLQSMERASALTGQLARQTQLAGQAGKNGALGFLAFSQGVEDAQYGIRGVLNNIPQMILGFGGGAGLAGAISLAAVAAVSLYPAIKKLFGSADLENLKKAADEFDKIFKAGMEAANQTDKQFKSERLLADAAAQFNLILRERVELMGSMGNFYDGELKAQREAASSAAEIARAVESQVSAMGGDLKPFIAKRQELDTAATDKDLKNRQDALEIVQANNLAAIEKRKNLAEEADSNEIKNNERLVELKTKLTGLEANLAYTQGEKKNYAPKTVGDRAFDGAGVMAMNALTPLASAAALAALKEEEENRRALLKQMVTQEREHKEAIKETKLELEKLENQMKVSSPAYKESLDRLDQEIKDYDQKTQKTYDEVKALEALSEKKKKLNEIERQNYAISKAQEALAKTKAAAPALQEAADTARQQQQALAPVLEDLGLSRAQRDGVLTPSGAREQAKGIQDRREAERRAKENGASPADNRRMIQQMREDAEWLAKNTGSTKERGEARRAGYQADRDEKRNQRIQKSIRDNESRDQNGRQKPDDRIDPNAKAAEADKRVGDAQNKADANAEAQVAIQRDIKEALEKLSNNLGTL